MVLSRGGFSSASEAPCFGHRQALIARDGFETRNKYDAFTKNWRRSYFGKWKA